MIIDDSFFLSDDEVREVTGYTRFGRQRAVLEQMGIRFFGHDKGKPVVIRQHYERATFVGPPAPDPEQVYIDQDMPWRRLGITINDWHDLNIDAWYQPAIDLLNRRIPRRDVDVLESGVYLLYADDGDLLYVGQSVCIENRIVSHQREGYIPFSHVSWVEVHRRMLNRVESEYIRTLLPPYNIRGIPWRLR